MPNLAKMGSEILLKFNTMAMVTMNISLNKELAEFVNKEVKEKKYANKSEFFRHLVRKYHLLHQPKKMPSKEDMDYYRMIDHSLAKDWMDDENEDLFLIK